MYTWSWQRKLWPRCQSGLGIPFKVWILLSAFCFRRMVHAYLESINAHTQYPLSLPLPGSFASNHKLGILHLKSVMLIGDIKRNLLKNTEVLCYLYNTRNLNWIPVSAIVKITNCYDTASGDTFLWTVVLFSKGNHFLVVRAAQGEFLNDHVRRI